MRKVYLSGEVTVMVAVTVKVDLIVRADEGANIEKEIEKHFKSLRSAKAKPPGKADVELVDVGDVASWGGFEEFDEAVDHAVNGGGSAVTIKSLKVEDSK